MEHKKNSSDDFIQKVTAEMKKKGTTGAFSNQAKRAGMSTDKFAKQVLDNPNEFSETTRKRAQFFKNINPEKFDFGGEIRRDYDVNVKSGVGTYAEGGKISKAGDVDNPDKLLDFAKGGNVENKDYVLESYYVYVHKDDYEEGELDMVGDWNSSDYGDNNKTFTSKSALMDFIKEVIDRDTQENNTRDDYFNIDSVEDATIIDYTVLCKTRRFYDNYEKASPEEIEKWKKGQLELFAVTFSFRVKVYEPRKKAEFARGGRFSQNIRRDYDVNINSGVGTYEQGGELLDADTEVQYAKGGDTKKKKKKDDQGFDDKLDESVSMRKGKEATKEQTFKDRRDESKAMEKALGRRAYSSVRTMDKNRRTLKRKK